MKEAASVEPIPETRALLDLLWTGDEQLEDWLLTRIVDREHQSGPIFPADGPMTPGGCCAAPAHIDSNRSSAATSSKKVAGIRRGGTCKPSSHLPSKVALASCLQFRSLSLHQQVFADEGDRGWTRLPHLYDAGSTTVLIHRSPGPGECVDGTE